MAKSKKSPKVSIEKNSQVAIEKIENGFLVRKSGQKGTGRNAQYYNKTYFSPTDPVAKITFGKKK